MTASSKRNVSLIAITVLGVIAERFAARSDKFMLILIVILVALGIFAVALALYRRSKKPQTQVGS
jgi:nitrate reductase gamma subunit